MPKLVLTIDSLALRYDGGPAQINVHTQFSNGVAVLHGPNVVSRSMQWINPHANVHHQWLPDPTHSPMVFECDLSAYPSNTIHVNVYFETNLIDGGNPVVFSREITIADFVPATPSVDISMRMGGVLSWTPGSNGKYVQISMKLDYIA